MLPSGVILPMPVPGSVAVTQRLPSGPTVSPAVLRKEMGKAKEVTTPLVVIREIFKSPRNQRLPSGPAVMASVERTSWSGNSVSEPVGVIRPIRPTSVNQRFPSVPVVMPRCVM
jgi:hypothetical protein